jgi:hypothetical protein
MLDPRTVVLKEDLLAMKDTARSSGFMSGHIRCFSIAKLPFLDFIGNLRQSDRT